MPERSSRTSSSDTASRAPAPLFLPLSSTTLRKLRTFLPKTRKDGRSHDSPARWVSRSLSSSPSRLHTGSGGILFHQLLQVLARSFHALWIANCQCLSFFFYIVSSTARTASRTTSVSSSRTMASANGGRSARHSVLLHRMFDSRVFSDSFSNLQTERSGYILYPYYVSLYGTTLSKWTVSRGQDSHVADGVASPVTTYAMIRLVLVSF